MRESSVGVQLWKSEPAHDMLKVTGNETQGKVTLYTEQSLWLTESLGLGTKTNS